MDGEVTSTMANNNSSSRERSFAQLETNKSERHVWLMKCPPMVYRSFTQQPPLDSYSPSGPLSAKVTVAVDPLLPSNDFSSTQFTMELVAAESQNIPKCYSMDMSTDFIPMSVFSESSEGRLSVEGKIYHKFDLKPHGESLEEYGRLCRERTNRYMTKTRQIQVIGNDNGAHMRPMPGLFVFKASTPIDKKKLHAKGSEVKRTRRDRGEVVDLMFRLFERQPNWTLKQLLHVTDQPEQFLKDMLKELCVYNNKGANQGTYELKSEYKKSVDEPGSK